MRMARFAVIGDPIAHSLSPQMHQAAYRELNLEHTYEAIRVSLGSVEAELERLVGEGYHGVNVTVPLKEAALAWSIPDAFAQAARAVNTLELRRRRGVNTDGPGFVQVLDRLGVAKDASVLLLGAGGSARAIALSVRASGRALAIWNRTAERAEALARACDGQVETELDLGAYDVVVNATSASMAGESLPLEGADRKAGVAIDLYYSGGATPFMERLSHLGWQAHDGRELLVEQGALSFEFWLGVAAPREAMRTAVGL